MTIYNIVEKDTGILVSQPRALQTVQQELEKIMDLEEIRKLFKQKS